MSDIELFHRFILVTAVAAGVGACGVALLLFAPRGWLGRAVIAAVGLAVASGIVGLLTPQFLGWVAGGGAAVALVGMLVSTAAVRQFAAWCARPLCRPRVVGLLAALAAGGVWGYEVLRLGEADRRLMDETLGLAAEAAPMATAPAGTARTDRGSPIELHSPTEPLPASELAAIEQSSAALSTWSGRYIQRGAAGDECNCHGWVFTGGKFNVGGRLVDTILTDNGYSPAPTPAVGDLCVYRDGERVLHSAVVRAVLADGTVLVEGKWGRMGVYLHAANESCYGTEFVFYRSARTGHLLNGLEDSGTVSATSHP